MNTNLRITSTEIEREIKRAKREIRIANRGLGKLTWDGWNLIPHVFANPSNFDYFTLQITYYDGDSKLCFYNIAL